MKLQHVVGREKKKSKLPHDELEYLSLLFCCSVLFDSATLWMAAHQAPLSMGFFMQEYWTGLPFPPLGGSS